jgi:hypothetical protein
MQKFYHYLAMKNIADLTGGKPEPQSISGVSAISAFYDIHGRKREVLFFYLSKKNKYYIKLSD